VVDTDEYPKAGVTMDSIAKLRPAFDKEGTVTAANASGINDGAAAVVLMRRPKPPSSARRRSPHRVVGHAGVDPAIMGTGPIPASRAALQKAGWKVEDLDLSRPTRPLRRRPCGHKDPAGHRQGQRQRRAIALGHPIGASGARVLTTLLFEMGKRNSKKGLATLCIVVAWHCYVRGARLVRANTHRRRQAWNASRFFRTASNARWPGSSRPSIFL